MKAFETLALVVDHRGVATLTLNRPDKHNAMSGRMIEELTEVAHQLSADEAVRVIILTGAGASFCAGGDLGWMQEQMASSRKVRIAEARKLALMLKALRDLPKPIIARVNGQAFGGGVGLISVCDAAIGVEDARFGLTEVRLGLIPATISPYVLARVGSANALRSFTSGRIFVADEARNIGLLNRSVPTDALDDAIEDEIRPYFSAAPAAVAAAKRLVQSLSVSIDENVIESTLIRLADTWETSEAAEGVSAFFQKRLPSWKKGE